MAQTQAQAEWYQKNKEKALQRAKEYRQNNLIRITAKEKLWWDANPEARMVIRARHRAKKSGMECTITKEDIIIPEKCPYLGLDLSEHSASLDRIDNTKGYIPGNVEVISQKANAMKSNATEEQLVRFATTILNRYSTKPYKELLESHCGRHRDIDLFEGSPI